MTPVSKNARIAGFLYLLLCISAPLRLVYIPNTLFVFGDASATANNILAHEALFRFGLFTDLFSGTLEIFLVLALYRLFKEVDQRMAILMVILGGVVAAPIEFLNVVNDAAALILVRGADFLSVFDHAQRDALAMLFLRLHSQVTLVAEIFWGLWLFPLAILVWRSRLLPRFLGVWLIINGCAYLALSLTGELIPQFGDMVSNFAFPAQLGELAFMLWILIMGAKERAVLQAEPAYV